MNRRNFIETLGLGIGGLIVLPMLSIGNPVPLYKEFDWLPFPANLLYRIENHNGIHSLGVKSIAARTYKAKIISDIDVDYTKETITKKIIDEYLGRDIVYPQLVYTNEILLKYAKEQRFTHIYTFFRFEHPVINPVTDKPYMCYYIRGLKMPDWKTQNGELQIVNV